MPSVVVPSESTIRKALSEFDLTVDATQMGQIQDYMKLLLAWNEKMNLTAIRDPLDILYRHFCESMFAVKVADMGKCRLADIGTGGGFPGLPLKILLPDAQLFLVESNVKKATFLAEVVRALGLSQTSVVVSRYEELGEEIAPINYMLTRALGDVRAFLKWASSQAVDAAHVMLWLGSKDAEEIASVEHWRWESMGVPQSTRRVILVGTKN